MPAYIGLMSGTSLDGIDAVLVDIDEGSRPGIQVRAHRHAPCPAALREELRALNRSGADELHRAARATRQMVDLAAALVRDVLVDAGTEARAVRAIGSHGQTVRHRPPGPGIDDPYTIQIDDGARLAELTGIDVVCDFRRRDLAAGGQGAPLVPAFHAAIFAQPGQAVAVLNLGGFANLTLLGDGGSVSGFDTGPANVLLDGWCERHLGARFDDAGRWALSGRVHQALLSGMLDDPYFAMPPPKSTGRDHFDLAWLDRLLAGVQPTPNPADVQATLLELTARTIASDLGRHAPTAGRLLVCGGGASNRALMDRLVALLPGVDVSKTDSLGLPASQVEATAFAWLAHAHLERQPGNRPEVTGARGPRILGAWYPAV